MNKDIKEDRLNIRINAEFKAKLKAAADKENRSLANFVVTSLQEKLDRTVNNQ